MDRYQGESGRKIISKRVIYNQMKPEDVEKYLQSQREVTNSPKISNLSLQPQSYQEISNSASQNFKPTNSINPFSHSHNTFVNLQNLHTDPHEKAPKQDLSNLTGEMASSTFGVAQAARSSFSPPGAKINFPQTPLISDQSCQYPSLTRPPG